MTNRITSIFTWYYVLLFKENCSYDATGNSIEFEGFSPGDAGRPRGSDHTVPEKEKKKKDVYLHSSGKLNAKHNTERDRSMTDLRRRKTDLPLADTAVAADTPHRTAPNESDYKWSLLPCLLPSIDTCLIKKKKKRKSVT
jgi:hypothetical protein